VTFAPAVSGHWSAFALGQDGVFFKLKSAAEKALSEAGLMLFMQLDQGAVVRKETDCDVPSIVRLSIGKLSTCWIPKSGWWRLAKESRLSRRLACLACRKRGVTMSELVEPIVSLEFYKVS
jgi:hypothetical protein